MMINSEFFYDNKLQCGTPTASRQNVLSRLKMPNPEVPFVFLNVIGHSVKSVTGSHSNEVEAKATRVLVFLLNGKGIPAEDILVICLYRDQKYLCDKILQDTQVSVASVDSAQGCKRSIVIVCTTRTHIDRNSNHTFFADPERLNVALSRSRDGLLLLGCIPDLLMLLISSSPS
ncbi:unnamed protein product [Heligmosomoides polygyrus]|uniref:AAA_12 domain-containing protein n=1 Tax=Heligmosomoides polygyrus TaxID=6339 RepID=A0A183FBE5_HELPZ|nr:unnamed protein product [Heligmosomoides polygyrus]